MPISANAAPANRLIMPIERATPSSPSHGTSAKPAASAPTYAPAVLLA